MERGVQKIRVADAPAVCEVIGAFARQAGCVEDETRIGGSGAQGQAAMRGIPQGPVAGAVAIIIGISAALIAVLVGRRRG
jgi:hypothetical protein